MYIIFVFVIADHPSRASGKVRSNLMEYILHVRWHCSRKFH